MLSPKAREAIEKGALLRPSTMRAIWLVYAIVLMMLWLIAGDEEFKSVAVVPVLFFGSLIPAGLLAAFTNYIYATYTLRRLNHDEG